MAQLSLKALFEELEQAGIRMLLGANFPEDAASLALVETCGFREIGRWERIGRMDGVWRDTIVVERQSSAIA